MHNPVLIVPNANSQRSFASVASQAQMRTHGLETFLATAHELRIVIADLGKDGELIFAKGDHEKAYRQ